MTLPKSTTSPSLILIYQTDDRISVDVILQDETLRLSQQQMATVFARAVSTINEHIKNIYADGELSESQTLHKFGNTEFMQK